MVSSEGATAPLWIEHGNACRRIKGEDVMCVRSLDGPTSQGMLFMVCDGHNGKAAAAFVAETLPELLSAKLPAQPGAGYEGSTDFALRVRVAMCEAMSGVDNAWLEQGSPAGTTVTVAVLIGTLLTVASIGDSEALLCYRNHAVAVDLTTCHRLETNSSERNRLEAAGCSVAPVSSDGNGPAGPGDLGLGPLRVWPGGICMSRSIGDVEAGSEVLPIPHIKQVLLDADNCHAQLIIASDGIWDAISRDTVVQLARGRAPRQVASDLVRAASTNFSVVDDASVLVVDMRACGLRPACLQRSSSLHSAKSFGLLSCLGFGALDRQVSQPLDVSDVSGVGVGSALCVPTHQKVTVLADEDGLVLCPELRQQLARNVLDQCIIIRGRVQLQHAAQLAVAWNQRQKPQQQQQQQQQQLPRLCLSEDGATAPSLVHMTGSKDRVAELQRVLRKYRSGDNVLTDSVCTPALPMNIGAQPSAEPRVISL